MTTKGMKSLVLAVLLMTAFCGGAQAGDAVKIEWEDLMPKATIPEDPLMKLPMDQQDAFENLHYWLTLSPQDKLSTNPEDIKEIKKAASEARALFKREGVDFDKLYERFNAREKVIDQINKTTIDTYNTKRISIAGYLLPLEFDKRGVTEFLLVPYVGACIHVPPPPINQTVFVHMNKRYKINGLFDPVWVSGRMKNTLVQKKLSLVDGNGRIQAGYSLSGDAVIAYTPPS